MKYWIQRICVHSLYVTLIKEQIRDVDTASPIALKSASCYGASPPSNDPAIDYYPSDEYNVSFVRFNLMLLGGPWVRGSAIAYLDDGTNVTIGSYSGTYSGDIPFSKLSSEQIKRIEYIRLSAEAGANGGDWTQKPKGSVTLYGEPIIWK